MKESMITMSLSVLCIILLLGVALGMCFKDHTAPQISLNGKNTLTYTEGDSYDVLLKDMVAEDDVDGDVTDTIRVSNLHVLSGGKAVVTYVAKDSSNNIGKLKREIRYKALETEESKTGGEGLPVNAGIAKVTGR